MGLRLIPLKREVKHGTPAMPGHRVKHIVTGPEHANSVVVRRDGPPLIGTRYPVPPGSSFGGAAGG
jgi:hypothetical protein